MEQLFFVIFAVVTLCFAVSSAPTALIDPLGIGKINFKDIRRKEVCYDDIGCFEHGSGTPFWAQTDLPDSPRDISPEFYFYNPKDKTKAQIINYFNLDATIEELKADGSKELYVATHGLGQDWPVGWMEDMRDLLQPMDKNVMLVRWTNGSVSLRYFKSAANTRVVGATIARVLLKLQEAGKALVNRTTILGHSLGCHVCGFAGERLAGLSQIIGLDPAGPLFGGIPSDIGPEARLDATDAELVQVIHTNGESLLLGGQGMMKAVGDIDFYSNGGKVQAGCTPGFSGDLQCSHSRAYHMFIEAIQKFDPHHSTCQYYAIKCESVEEEDTPCKPCNQSAGGCPAFGIDRSLLNGFSGNFSLVTFADQTYDHTHCGYQLLTHLRSSDHRVKGNVTISFDVPNAPRAEMLVLHEKDSMEKGAAKSENVVFPWSLRHVDSISMRVLYVRHDALIGGGPVKWQMDKLKFTDFEGRNLRICDPVTLETGVATDVEVKREC